MDKSDVYLVFIVLVLVAGTLFSAYVVWMCRKRGYTLIQIENGALSASSLQTLVLLFATLVAGLWAAFTVDVSGSLELSKLQLEERKVRNTPSLKIDMQVEGFAPVTAGKQALIPMHVVVSVENPGSRATRLDFDRIPLVTLARVEGPEVATAVKTPLIHLPYTKLECPIKGNCSTTQWKTGYLEAGGIGYYAFLHPGLPAGLYYVQFQLPVPDEMRLGKFDPNKPVLWSRARYFQLEPRTDRISGASASAKPVPADL